MDPILNDKLLIPVTLPACEVLLKRHVGHCLHRFIGFRDTTWIITPQHAIPVLPCGWDKEDQATIVKWLASDGFRVFMLSGQRVRFRNPVVDCVGGKLVIRSGKKKITPLEA